MSHTFVEIITDQEYIDLVKLWKSNDPVDSNEMVDMIEFCIEKFDVTINESQVSALTEVVYSVR